VIIALENSLLINVVIMIIVVELDECRVIHIDCYEQFVKLLLDECRAIPIDCYKQFLKMLNKQNSSWGNDIGIVSAVACDDAKWFSTKPPTRVKCLA
jgi:hypothetical protein